MKTENKGLDENKDKKADESKKKNKRGKHKSALQAASIGRSATAQAHRHSNTGMASTGTNISYEGATAPGAGGSVGTGYASGKEAVDEKIRTNSDFEQNRGGVPTKDPVNNEKKADEYDVEDIDEDFYMDDDF